LKKFNEIKEKFDIKQKKREKDITEC